MEKTLHKVKAYLYENQLTDDPNDFIARVSSERSLNVEDICKSAVTRGGADISAEAMRHGVELFQKEMAYLLSDGYSVNTGYFTATTLIKGIFNSPRETFNADKHSVLFKFNQGEAMRKELSNIEVQIMGVAENGLRIAQVTDVKSNTVNDSLTPGFNLKISGYKIKLAGDDTSVGVYFRNIDTDTSTQVAASDIVINNPSDLIVVIPALPSGEYQLEIVTQFTGNALLKEPRTVSYEKLLKVQ